MIDVLEKLVVPIVLALITASGLWFKTYLDYRTELKKRQNLSKENETLKQEVYDLSLPVEMDLQTFNDIKDIVEEIFYATKTDRFLILTATNGVKDMRFATAVYEHHKHKEKVALSIGATSKYIKFEFDSAYRLMLKRAEAEGCVVLNTDEMEECDLKAIYDSEEVKHSVVSFIMRAKMDAQNDRLFYCSTATHTETAFTKNELVHIRIAVGKLKNIFKSLN